MCGLFRFCEFLCGTICLVILGWIGGYIGKVYYYETNSIEYKDNLSNFTEFMKPDKYFWGSFGITVAILISLVILMFLFWKILGKTCSFLCCDLCCMMLSCKEKRKSKGSKRRSKRNKKDRKEESDIQYVELKEMTSSVV